MAITSAQVSIGSSATLISSATTTSFGGITSSNPTRLVVYNNSAGDVFLGGSSVTTGTGFRLPAGEALLFLIDGDDTLYGVSATTGTVHVLKQD